MSSVLLSTDPLCVGSPGAIQRHPTSIFPARDRIAFDVRNPLTVDCSLTVSTRTRPGLTVRI